jgi:lysophospholipase L1-like esterase
VTIQFGHNDQKTLTLQQYSDNLSTMIGEVKNAGGTAVSEIQDCHRHS